MFLFCKKEILLLLFVQLRKSPGIGLELESSPGNESPGIWIKSWKWKSWNLNQVLEMKVLEVESSPGNESPGIWIKSWNLNQVLELESSPGNESPGIWINLFGWNHDITVHHCVFSEIKKVTKQCQAQRFRNRSSKIGRIVNTLKLWHLQSRDWQPFSTISILHVNQD